MELRVKIDGIEVEEGEKVEDLQKFHSEEFVDALFLKE